MLRYIIAAAMLFFGAYMSFFVFLFSGVSGMKGGDAPFFLSELPSFSIVLIPLIYAASVLGVLLSYRRKELIIVWASVPVFFTTVVYLALNTWWLEF